MKKTITIHVVSDVVCPWCYVGKKRLEKAMSKLEKEFDFEVIVHPYELNPLLPENGTDFKRYLSSKFGSSEKMEKSFTYLTGIGKELNIDFHFDKIQKAFRTFHLHKLLYVALAEDLQEKMQELFFKAYFEEGKDLTDIDTIASLLAPLGWDKTKVENILQDDEIGLTVKENIDYVESLGITGVPFFIIQQYGISGAQSVEVFEEAIREIAALPEDSHGCGHDGCGCH
ncbi:MAG: DsbA family oxidoreductase [Flammeovirgaceae bacterium]|nr:DsbA family oxidoreductase [Flammeovirgaceae bacterium]MDW8288490.1 DsbA family oxidoreductase [Flammeovirgaceae bacterium]